MAAAAKAAAAAKEARGSGQQRDEEQQPLMQPAGGASKDGAGGLAKGVGEGRAMAPTPGRVKEQKMSDDTLPASVRYARSRPTHSELKYAESHGAAWCGYVRLEPASGLGAGTCSAIMQSGVHRAGAEEYDGPIRS